MQDKKPEQRAEQNPHEIVDAQFSRRRPVIRERHEDLSQRREHADHYKAQQVKAGRRDKGREHHRNRGQRAEGAEKHDHRKSVHAA